MNSCHSLFGSNRSPYKEARLCGMSPGGPELGVEGPHPWVTNTQEFFTTTVPNFVSRVFTGVDNRELLAKQNAANLRSETAWVNAYQTPNIFTVAALPTTTIPASITPVDVLLRMPPQERIRSFYQFIRAIIRRSTLTTAPIRPEFNYPGLQQLNPPSTLDAPAPAHLAFLLQVAGLLSGQIDPREAGRATPDAMQVARLSFNDIYAVGTPGVMYEDYASGIRTIRTRFPDGSPGAPTTADITNPEYLLSNLPASRFRNWLAVNLTPGPDLDARRKTVMADLGRVSGQLIERDNKRVTEIQTNNEEFNKLRTDVTQNILRQNNTFMDNFRTMEPWQQLAVTGLGAYALYKMWNSKSRIVQAIPPALVGTYLYLRLVNGDPNALNTMVTAGTGILRPLVGAVRGGFNRAGLFVDQETEDRNRLAIMGRYFDQKGFASLYPYSLSFMTLSEVPMRHLGGAFRVTMNDRNQPTMSLSGPPGSPLYAQMEGICRSRSYDRGMVFGMFEQNNPMISESLGTVFYSLAASRPENAAEARLVESARITSAGPTPPPGSVMENSYGMIRDPAARAAYVNLVRRGMMLAQSPAYANRPFHTVIAELANGGPEVQPDLAEHITVADRTSRLPAERRVHTLGPAESLNNNRAESLTLLREEFEQSLERRLTPFLEPDAIKRVNEAANLILNSNKPLQETRLLQQQLEYTLLVAAIRNGEAKLTALNVNDVIGENNATWLASLPDHLRTWTERNVVGITSSFRRVSGIDDVLNIISGRLGSEITGPGTGFDTLRKHLEERKRQISQMRTPESAQKLLVAALQAQDPAAVTRLGGPAAAGEFARRILDTDQYRNDIFNHLEQAYAQSIATDIAEAMLTTHRRAGPPHSLDAIPADRRVTLVEMSNIAELARERGDRMFGSGERLGGTFASLAMRQALSSYNPVTDLPPVIGTFQGRLKAVEHVRFLGALYLTLQPIPESFVPPLLGPIDTHLRNRVRSVAEQLIAVGSAGDPEFRIQCQDIANVMELLGMTSDPVYTRIVIDVLSASVSIVEPLTKTMEEARKAGIDRINSESETLRKDISALRATAGTNATNTHQLYVKQSLARVEAETKVNAVNGAVLRKLRTQHIAEQTKLLNDAGAQADALLPGLLKQIEAKNKIHQAALAKLIADHAAAINTLEQAYRKQMQEAIVAGGNREAVTKTHRQLAEKMQTEQNEVRNKLRDDQTKERADDRAKMTAQVNSTWDAFRKQEAAHRVAMGI